MDWNRRWAKERGLPSIEGHKEGGRNVERILNSCLDRCIEIVSAWALSSDNFKKRSTLEVKWILSMLDDFDTFIWKELYSKVKIDFVWDIEALPEKTKRSIEKIKNDTENNSEMTFIIALNYGWKEEIIRWFKKFIKEGWDVDSLDENSFEEYIETMKYPPCDVIVRTGWDIRHSGYFLYSCPYSEYYFSDKRWPDFNSEDLDDVLNFFNWCKRNFWA